MGKMGKSSNPKGNSIAMFDYRRIGFYWSCVVENFNNTSLEWEYFFLAHSIYFRTVTDRTVMNSWFLARDWVNIILHHPGKCALW
jgi:hypothetical protein